MLPLPARGAALELTGRVLDAAGTPVAEALVELQPVLPFIERSRQLLEGQTDRVAARSVRTSKSGEYLLAVPESGMWQVEISAAGKAPVRCKLLPLLESEVLPDAVLEPDAGLEVRVEDGAGAPLEGAQVFVQLAPTERRRSPWRQSSPWTASGRYGRTGTDGRVQLARQAGKKLRVHAFAHGHLPGEISELEASTTTVRLTAGRPVTVRVETASGEPVSKAVLTVSSLSWVAASTDDKGEASVFVTPDEPLPLSVWRETGQVESTELTIPAAETDAAQTAEIKKQWRLPEPVELRGVVLDKDTRAPLAKALLWTSDDAGAFRSSDSDGRYTLVRRRAQRWYLEAAAPGYGFTRTEALLHPDGPRVPTLALARAYSLIGRVIDPQGEAIAEATVRVSTLRQTVIARSDAEGAFRMDGLTAERPYELTAEADGFAPEQRNLTLEPELPLEIVLHPGTAVIGRLVTPEGAPVAGGTVAMVAVESDPRMQSPSFRTGGPPRAESDAEGRFRLDELPRLPMALVAGSDGMADKVLLDLDLTTSGTPLDLGDIELEWGVELRGRVRSKDGDPIEGAVVMVLGGGANPSLMAARSRDDRPPEVKTDSQGRFMLDGLTQNLRYNASVRHEDYVDTYVSEIDLGADEPLEVVLHRAARVSGRVLDESGAAIENVQVQVRTVAGDAAPTNFMQQASRSRPGFSRADGAFEVTGISPGRIEVTVRPGRGWIASEPLTLTVAAGDERTGLVLRVGTGAEVTGRVTDGRGTPVIGATVQITVRRTASNLGMSYGTSDSTAEARTDGDGLFVLRGLDPSVADPTVTVQHSDYATLEQPLELRPGSNRLDLVLQDGSSLAGVVVTESGEPVEGAQVAASETMLWPGSYSMSQGPAAESRSDGTFELKGLGKGVFELRAMKSGFAASATQEVEIREGEQAFVTLTLIQGGTIRGRLLGVEPEQLGQVVVMAADSAGGLAMGLVGDDGEYRIPNVGFAEGKLMASSQLTGQTVHESFSLDTRGGEIWLDLEFGTGSSLNGLVLLNGEPVAHAMVFAQGAEGRAGQARTDAGGRFRLSGLADGSHQVSVMVVGSPGHTESVAVRGDTELTIDISSVRVSGRVLAESGGEPIAGAQVWATVENELTSGFGGARAETTTGGEFDLFVPAGRQVVLRAKAPDYAEASLELSTAAGGAVTGLELLLSPGAGLELDVRLWTGLRPGFLSVALVDANGSSVLADILMGRSGRTFRLGSAPPGNWTLLLSAQEGAVVSLPVAVPGPPVEAVLPQAAKLSIEIANPEVGTGTRLRLVSPTGDVLRFPAMGQVLSEWPVFGSSSEIPFVPAGTWTLELIDGAGAVRSKTVTAVAGAVASVVFE